MLNRVNTFQTRPILEPYHVVLTASFDKRFVHVVVDFFASFRSQVTSGWIIDKIKLRPDDDMDNSLVNAIWPVIKQNLVVIYALSIHALKS